MANSSKNPMAVGDAWTDLVATDATLANVDVDLQFIGRGQSDHLEYVLSGAQPASKGIGRHLPHRGSVTVNSDHIWVRSDLDGRVIPVVL